MRGERIPEDLIAKYPHLRQYLASLLESKISEPEYYESLPMDLKRSKMFNVIYHVDDVIFAHVYRLSPVELASYIVVQPEIPEDVSELADLVDELIARHVTPEMSSYRSQEEMIEILRGLLSRAVSVDESLRGREYNVIRSRGVVKRLVVSQELYDAIYYTLIRDKVYLGIIEPLLRDPYLEDISCSGLGPIYVHHKVFGLCRTNVEFRDLSQLTRFVMKLSERIERPVSIKRPIVDGRLPDGSRINIVFSTDVSLRGPNFTIRKFSKVPLSITQLIKLNTISSLEAAYIWLLLEHDMNVWICGETASGKTTMLNAIIPFIRFDYKIVSIEDTPEIFVPHENWIREMTREGGEGGEKITLFDLLKAALRQRPNYIIVGEVRGAEAYVAFQAMQTGHPVLTTFHAGSVEKLVQRLTSDPINVPKTFIDNLNAVTILSAVRVPRTRTLERRVMSVDEIVGYDPVEKRLNYITVFEWSASSDEHVFRGHGSSYLLEEKIARLKGLSGRNVKLVYDELEIRAHLLDLLINMGVFNYFDVWNAIMYAYVKGVDKAVEDLERGIKIWQRV